MSSHIQPTRWADAFAGKVSAAERSVMEQHAASCKACKRTRDRVRRASDSFGAIQTQAAPELPWDSVRARVHWAVSKEKREKRAPAKPSRPRVPLLAWAALAAAAPAVEEVPVVEVAVETPVEEVAVEEAPAETPAEEEVKA